MSTKNFVSYGDAETLFTGVQGAIKDIYAAMGEMGAKNLIPYPYYDESGKDNRGVVFTYGNDGIVYMNGTSEQSSQPFLRLQSHLTLNPASILESHSYILYCDSDSPYVFSVIYFKNGGDIQANLTFSYEYSDGETGTATQNYISLLKGGVIRKWVKFTVTSGNALSSQIDIRVDQGAHQVNNSYGKVMLMDGRDTDLTWKIFAKTNKQLTDDVALLDREKADTDMVAADFNAGTSYTAGNYCIYDGKFYKFKNNHTGAWSAADVDEIKIAGELSSLKSGLTNAAKILHINAPADKTDVGAFLGHILASVINNQTLGAYVVDGAWVNHNYYTGIVYKISADTAIGMIQYGIYGGGADDMSMYSACYKTNVFSNYKTVQYQT